MLKVRYGVMVKKLRNWSRLSNYGNVNKFIGAFEGNMLELFVIFENTTLFPEMFRCFGKVGLLYCILAYIKI